MWTCGGQFRTVSCPKESDWRDGGSLRGKPIIYIVFSQNHAQALLGIVAYF